MSFLSLGRRFNDLYITLGTTDKRLNPKGIQGVLYPCHFSFGKYLLEEEQKILLSWLEFDNITYRP